MTVQRQPRGTPAGGRFAGSDRAAPDIFLGLQRGDWVDEEDDPAGGTRAVREILGDTSFEARARMLLGAPATSRVLVEEEAGEVNVGVDTWESFESVTLSADGLRREFDSLPHLIAEIEHADRPKVTAAALHAHLGEEASFLVRSRSRRAPVRFSARIANAGGYCALVALPLGDHSYAGADIRGVRSEDGEQLVRLNLEDVIAVDPAEGRDAPLAPIPSVP